MCVLNTYCKRIARNKRSARTLCAQQISFACLCVSQEPVRWVYCTTIIQNAQVCEHIVRSCTRQHAVARSCNAPLHRCPSLCVLTCVGNENFSGIGTYNHRSVPVVSHISQNQRTSGLI